MARNTYTYSSKDLLKTTLGGTPAMRDALKNLSTRCKDNKGSYMDRSQIIRSMIRALMKLEGQVNWEGINSEEVLVTRLIRAFSKS